jgi:hypothetical protein
VPFPEAKEMQRNQTNKAHIVLYNPVRLVSRDNYIRERHQWLIHYDIYPMAQLSETIYFMGSRCGCNNDMSGSQTPDNHTCASSHLIRYPTRKEWEENKSYSRGKPIGRIQEGHRDSLSSTAATS